MILNICDSRVIKHEKRCSIYYTSPASFAPSSLPTLLSPSPEPRKQYLCRLPAITVEELVDSLLPSVQKLPEPFFQAKV